MRTKRGTRLQKEPKLKKQKTSKGINFFNRNTKVGKLKRYLSLFAKTKVVKKCQLRQTGMLGNCYENKSRRTV